MAAPIRGMRPYDAGGNDYKFAHAAGQYFRKRPHDAHGPAVKLVRHADGTESRTVTIMPRKRTLNAAAMTDKQVLAAIARSILSDAKPRKSKVYRAPTLSIRG